VSSIDGVQHVGGKVTSLITVWMHFNKCLRCRHWPTGHRRVTASGTVYDIRTCRQIKHIDTTCPADISCCAVNSSALPTARRPNIQRLLILSHRIAGRPPPDRPTPHSPSISCNRPPPSEHLPVATRRSRTNASSVLRNSRDDAHRARDNARRLFTRSRSSRSILREF